MVIELKMLNDGSANLKMQLFLFNLYTCKISIIHDHNTRSKKQLSFEDAMEKMESNILEQISSLKVDVRSMKDEFLNMKDVIIKCLQDENALLRS